MDIDRKDIIYDKLLRAVEKSFISLFNQHREHYYYCALVMMEISAPCIAAMSEEALEKLVKENFNAQNDIEIIRKELKWSYGDSPYIGFGYKDNFKEVDELFNSDVLNSDISEAEYEGRVNDWKKIMVDVLKTLIDKGLFKDYSNMFINAEYYPPEGVSNVLNARELNSESNCRIWFEENKEIYNDNDVSESIDWNEVWRPKLCKVILVKPLAEKKTGVKLRKDFNSTLGLSEFIKKACDSAPLVINEKFVYKTALQVVSDNPEYSDIISLEPI